MAVRLTMYIMKIVFLDTVWMKQKVGLKGPNKVSITSGSEPAILEITQHQHVDVTN